MYQALVSFMLSQAYALNCMPNDHKGLGIRALTPHAIATKAFFA